MLKKSSEDPVQVIILTKKIIIVVNPEIFIIKYKNFNSFARVALFETMAALV